MAVVDFAFERPSVAALKAAGVTGVLRYVCEDASKMMTTTEARSYVSEKIAYGLVYEDATNDFSEGANMGVAKAKIAAPLLSALAFESGRPVYCAVDYDIPEALYQITWEGIHAFCVSLSRPDACYGPRPFLQYLEQVHGVGWLWEVASSDWNGDGPEPKQKRLQQNVGGPAIGGAAVDYNTVVMSDWGQFPAPDPIQPPKPKPVPVPVPPKPSPSPTPIPYPEDDVNVQTVTVLMPASAVQATASPSPAVPFDKALSVTVVAGTGTEPPVSPSIVADTQGNTLVVAKIESENKLSKSFPILVKLVSAT